MFGYVHYLGCDVIEKAIHEGVTYYTIDHVEEINQNLSGFFHAPFVWEVKPLPPCLPVLHLCFDMGTIERGGWGEDDFLKMIKVIDA